MSSRSRSLIAACTVLTFAASCSTTPEHASVTPTPTSSVVATSQASSTTSIPASTATSAPADSLVPAAAQTAATLDPTTGTLIGEVGDGWKVAYELSKTEGVDFRIFHIDHGVGAMRLTDPDAVPVDLSGEGVECHGQPSRI